jgi:hypothetical protein
VESPTNGADGFNRSREDRTDFFRQELAVDRLTMSVCVECCTLVAISDELRSGLING